MDIAQSRLMFEQIKVPELAKDEVLALLGERLFAYMFVPHLHMIGWHSPKTALKVDLAPSCQPDILSTGSGQDRKFHSRSAP